MNSEEINITTLSEDISQTVKQGFGDSLDMMRFCRDHHNPYLLYDKRAVLPISQDEFLRVFSFNSHHFFILPDHIIRLGEYCKLYLPNTIALMMKAEWELFLSSVTNYKKGSGADLKRNLTDPDITGRYIPEFNPWKDKLCNLILSSSYGTDKNLTYNYISFLISDLLSGKRFLKENMRIGDLYPEKNITEFMFLSKLTVPQQADYKEAKELWSIKSTELDELLFLFERKKRMNLNTENKYFRTFCALESKKSEIKLRIEKYEIILSIQQDQPGISFRELLRLSSDRMEEANRKRADLRNKISRSLNYITNSFAGDGYAETSAEYREHYLRECRRLLRKLFFLLHSDTCPNYSILSGKKQGQINSLWLMLMKSTDGELMSYSPSMLLYHLPDYEQLESIYLRACTILDIKPDNFEPGDHLEFMVRKGTSFDEVMEFLKRETERIELHLARLELIREEYTNEIRSQYYRDALKNITVHSGLLEKEISEMKQQLAGLKLEIRNMLSSVQNGS